MFWGGENKRGGWLRKRVKVEKKQAEPPIVNITERRDGLSSNTYYSIGEFAEKVKKSFWEEARDQVRTYVKRLVEGALEGCRREAAGCGWHERSQQRKDYCNGYYERIVESVYGEVEIRVPRLRRSSYVHELFERYERRSDELSRVIEAAYLRGHSTRGLSAFMDEVFRVRLSGRDKPGAEALR